MGAGAIVILLFTGFSICSPFINLKQLIEVFQFSHFWLHAFMLDITHSDSLFVNERIPKIALILFPYLYQKYRLRYTFRTVSTNSAK